jgi:hypothetical protein
MSERQNRLIDPIDRAATYVSRQAGLVTIHDERRRAQAAERFAVDTSSPVGLVAALDTLPEAGPTWYRRWVLIRGGPGVADTLYACQKNAADAYVWVATGSLGYTPVNKAGDTMTGTLTFSGTAGIAASGGTVNAGTLQQGGVGVSLATHNHDAAYVNESGDSMSGGLTIAGLLNASQLIADPGVKFYYGNLNAGITASTANITAYVDAITVSFTLPTGTWRLYCFCWGTYRNSVAANGATQLIDVGGTLSGATTNTTDTANDRVTLMSSLGVLGLTGARTVKGRYHTSGGGTAFAENSMLVVVAVRTA